jgi:hypothetical protein
VATRVLEWDVRVPLVSNVYVLVDILLLVVFISAVLAGAILFMTGFSSVFTVLRLFVIADAFFIVALFMVMVYVFTSLFQLHYRLDADGVLLRLGEFDSGLNHAAWVVSSLAQRLSFTGGRVYRLVNKEQYVQWGVVARAVFDVKRRVANLTSDTAPLMRVHCNPDNVDAVFTAIRDYLPEPED